MEEVAIMVPASTTIANDDLSDETESINLDLHVSDTEDSTESTKKSDHIESEEDILNKYVDDNAEDIKESEEPKGENEKATLPNGAKSLPSEESTNYEKCNGNASPILGEIEEEEEEEDGGGDTKKPPEIDNKEEEEKKDDDDKVEVISDETEEEEIPSKQTEEVCEENEEKMDEDIVEEEAKSESEIEKIEDECEKASSEETNKETSDLPCEESDEINETNDRTIVDSEISDKKPDDSAETKDNIDELPKETDNSNSEVISDKEKLDDKTSEDETTDPKPSSTTTDETKTEELEDNDDLLCVMEEKTEDGTTDHKDENSCSASEKDEETKDAEEDDETKDAEQDDETKDQEEERENEEKEQEQEEAIDETKEDEELMEENQESQLDMDVDNSEIAMDIEESDIGGVLYSDNDQSRDSKTPPDKDANKENELESDVVVSKSSSAGSSTIVKENGLTNGDIDEVVETETKVDEVKTAGADNENNDDVLKKSSKRQLSDTSTEDDSPKKIKLTNEPETSKPLPEKRPVYQLDSLKKFMLDKKLKKLTRFELEELCIQKVCECIVNKSEIGELRQKVLLQEQTIDTWRKEAIVVAKQTRDLKIVHERLMADLKVMKEQTGKPLVPVKITRSVGLQAIIENPSRVRSVPIISGPTTTSQPRTPIVNNQTKTVASPQNRQQVKPKVIQRPQNNNRPLQPITQKNNVSNSNTKPKPVVPSSPQPKKPADPKTVIDLTDEDEKNHNAKKTTTTASPTVRILNKQSTTNANSNSNTKQVTTPNSQASKIMFVSPNVLQRNSAVMVKMNSNGLVSPQNGLTTIPNGQVSVVTTPSVRTVSQVRVPVTSVATVRTTQSVQQSKQLFKHPAPLPAAPNYQISAPGKKPIPPKPHLNLTRSSCGTGIVLQWKMPYKLEAYEPIVSYQLYAYQETKSPPKTDNWGKIGDVKALELPMAVTLTQFAVGNRYFFAVRAVDSQKRLGPFSEPESILL